MTNVRWQMPSAPGRGDLAAGMSQLALLND
jgi:hypothetical protein